MAKRLWVALIASLSVSTLVQAQDPQVLPSPNLQQPDAVLAPGGEDAKAGDGEKPKDDLDKLMSMDLDQLGNVDVVQESTPAALTEVPSDRNIVPAAVTHISKEDIWRCGGRNLDEVLDIYVPNLELVRHHWEQSHLGLRGIISDREDKYLLLVNDRIMNDKTHFGAASERELPELDDIDHIDVIRGPGSNIYGPGAVSMVIAIYTDTSKTFTGTKAVARGGAIESFTSLELKHAQQWKDAEGGYLIYGGVGTDDGANGFDAPLVLGSTDPGDPGFGSPPQYRNYQAGDVVRHSNFREGDAFDNTMPLKFFADVQYEDWEVWARYTRSSESFPLAVAAGLDFNAGQAGPNYPGLGGFGSFVPQFQSGSMNQQATVQSKYETDLDEENKFQFMVGFDHSEIARSLFSGISEAYGEEELNSRLIMISTLGDHQIAYGGEFYNDWFGLPSHLVDAPPTIGRLGGTAFDPWTTQTYSALFEDQWEISEEWTTFLGFRWDKNTYTPWMYSPRAAIVYTPNEMTSWKLMANRSQRMNFAEELRELAQQWHAQRPGNLAGIRTSSRTHADQEHLLGRLRVLHRLGRHQLESKYQRDRPHRQSNPVGPRRRALLARLLLERRRQPQLHPADQVRARRPDDHDLHHGRAQRLRQRPQRLVGPHYEIDRTAAADLSLDRRHLAPLLLGISRLGGHHTPHERRQWIRRLHPRLEAALPRKRVLERRPRLPTQ